MKKTLLLACTLLLASCIDVMNFGIYWNRGYLEPSLVGTWDPIPVAGQDLGTLKRQRLTIKGDTYVITSYEGGIEKTDAPMVGRLLLVSHLTFLMLGGQTQGALYRYKLEGKDVVKFYNLDKVAAQKFVAENFRTPKTSRVAPAQEPMGRLSASRILIQRPCRFWWRSPTMKPIGNSTLPIKRPPDRFN